MKALAIVVALLRVAHADGWQDKTAHAERITHLEELVWALTAACDSGDDVVQRQCRHLRDRRVAALANATLLIDGEADALELGAWNPAKKSLSVRLAACIRCGGIEVDGKRIYVVGTTAQQHLEGDKVRASAIYDSARSFPTEAAADKWRAAMRRPRVELVVRVPAKPRWQLAGKPGVVLEIIGYRVYAPCTGEIAIETDASLALIGDPTTCPKDADEQPPEQVSDLDAEVIHNALRPVDDAALVCFGKLGLAGKADLVISIAADGSIARLDQSGDFKGTPTGDCIDRAVHKVKFPRAKNASKIHYPIILGRP